ncbi:hypothetical protein ACLEEB_14300 [Lonsdalea quercina]|uniref:hypothetical protein n=1 Tax=Lonsdalea quercina TaxID=71657 RepID=UPI003974873F
MTYKTLQLDTSSWDLTFDAQGNIATASGGYAAAQDVASACLVFSGECYYDNTLGIPWKEDVLGGRPSPGYIAKKMEAEAKKLDVVDQAMASIFFDKSTRQARGVIRITDTDGNESQATI